MKKTLDKNKIIDIINKNWSYKHFDTAQRDLFIEILIDKKIEYCLETGFCTGASSATTLAITQPKKMISVSLAHNNMEIAKNLSNEYNFKLMDKYGHCFFNLVFQKPNIGILYHRYHTQEEYEGSIKLREQQKKHMNSNDIQYKYEIKDNFVIML